MRASATCGSTPAGLPTNIENAMYNISLKSVLLERAQWFIRLHSWTPESDEMSPCRLGAYFDWRWRRISRSTPRAGPAHTKAF
jgi:hypothetical protein